MGEDYVLGGEVGCEDGELGGDYGRGYEIGGEVGFGAGDVEMDGYGDAVGIRGVLAA